MSGIKSAGSRCALECVVKLVNRLPQQLPSWEAWVTAPENVPFLPPSSSHLQACWFRCCSKSSSFTVKKIFLFRSVWASLDHFNRLKLEGNYTSRAAAVKGHYLCFWVSGKEILSGSVVVGSGQANAAQVCQIYTTQFNLSEGCLSVSSIFSIGQASQTF